MTSPLSESTVVHLAGALNERAEDDGAVGNRDARYMSAFAVSGPLTPPTTTCDLGTGGMEDHPALLDRRQLPQLSDR